MAQTRRKPSFFLLSESQNVFFIFIFDILALGWDWPEAGCLLLKLLERFCFKKTGEGKTRTTWGLLAKNGRQKKLLSVESRVSKVVLSNQKGSWVICDSESISTPSTPCEKKKKKKKNKPVWTLDNTKIIPNLSFDITTWPIGKTSWMLNTHTIFCSANYSRPFPKDKTVLVWFHLGQSARTCTCTDSTAPGKTPSILMEGSCAEASAPNTRTTLWSKSTEVTGLQTRFSGFSYSFSGFEDVCLVPNG